MQKVLTFLFAAVWLGFSPPLSAQEPAPRELFPAAYALFSQNKGAEAEAVFLKTLDRGYPLEDYSLYYLTQLALARQDGEGAKLNIVRLRQKFPQSIWLPPATLELAKLSLSEKNYAQAIEQLRALRALQPKGDTLDEAAYLLGQAYNLAGDLKQTYSTYQELRRSSPLSRWGAAVRKEVNALREKYPDLFGPATLEAQLSEAELLTKEQAYAEAEKLYRVLLVQTPRGDLRPRLLTALASVQRAQRKRDEAVPLLTEIVREFPDSPEAPTALHHLATIYWNRDDNLKALEHFGRLRERYPASAHVDHAQFASARIYESLGNIDQALAQYQALAERSRDGELREEAGWRPAWIYYLRGDDNAAYAAFKRLAARRDNTRYGTAALYWQGRMAYRLERRDEAKQIFLGILRDPDESYYKGAAAGWLERMGVAVEEKSAAPSTTLRTGEASAASAPEPQLNATQTFHLARARELSELALNQLATAELDELRNRGVEPLPLRLLLLREYERNRAFNRSVALAGQIATGSEDLFRYRYPLAYWETVKTLAQEKGLDPYLVVGLIRQESSFDPNAVSRASALGLMQLLQSTAAQVARRLRLQPPDRERLFEPGLNVALGTQYLKDLLQRYSNNIVKAIAAYNAGENAVARWEKQIGPVEEDEFIERISYSETRLYVKLVLRNLRIYRKLYGGDK
jgi:soluble lytic murein transglycosylase-like protein/TolA-binding protein